ncbi:hypothetical protein ATK36_5415 [Amycolatopsis sulphurea]|uniref:Uncharacterized protein n=2 Tax=Amycolatopsis sulphurea TaxID=76022 RepID=A0A2A9FHG0_9PSEU|nr:hypothetical protein ATK36_5415 [Amycolatopsis sulphurea]
MPREFLLLPNHDLCEAVTAYLPRVGRLDDELSDEIGDAALANERATATRAIRQSIEPNLALLQRVLDGLRRL